MYKKVLLLLTISTLLATLLALACSLPVYKTSYAMPGSTVEHKHAQIVIPGSSVVPLANMNVEAIAAVTSRDIWIAGEYSKASNQFQAFYEHFDGLQWQVIDAHILGNGSNITSLSAVSSNDIWAVGRYADGALIEHWDGSHWSLADENVSSNDYLSSVIAPSANNVWAVGASYLPDGFHSATLIKHFDGSHWQVVYSPSVGTKCGLSSITAISPTELWAVGSSYNVGTITEHYIGGSWSLVPDPNAYSPQSEGASGLSSVSASNSNDVWAVGDTNGGQGGPLIERWNGSDWSLSSNPPLDGTSQRLTSVIALQTKYVWAMGSYTDPSNNYRPFVTYGNGYDWNILALPDNLTSLNVWQQLGRSSVFIGIGTYDKQIKLVTIPAL